MSSKYFDDEMAKTNQIIRKTEEINQILNTMGCVSTMKDEVRDKTAAIRRFLFVYNKTCVDLKKLSDKDGVGGED